MVSAIATVPLRFQPGTAWEYGVGVDLIGRLIEVVGGMTLEAFLTTRVLGPLEMTDTRFFVPDTDQGRLVAVYAGADPLEPLAPGLRRADEWPYPGAYRRRFPRHWAGGGLVSTLPDMVSLLRSLLPLSLIPL